MKQQPTRAAIEATILTYLRDIGGEIWTTRIYETLQARLKVGLEDLCGTHLVLKDLCARGVLEQRTLWSGADGYALAGLPESPGSPEMRLLRYVSLNHQWHTVLDLALGLLAEGLRIPMGDLVAMLERLYKTQEISAEERDGELVFCAWGHRPSTVTHV
jgi:hypothetical protein